MALIIPPSVYRQRMEDSNDRFQAAMLAAMRSHGEAIKAHAEGVQVFLLMDQQLHESVEELKRLIMDQGAELRGQRHTIEALERKVDGLGGS